MPARTSRASEIAAQIESDILKAGATSGAHVGLRKDLLERFSTSPSVINEALRILRERGLIAVKPGPHGGIFVAEDVQWMQLSGINMWFRRGVFSPQELLGSRVHLEDLFARVALEKITPEDARPLEWAFDDLKTSTANATDYWRANLRLHLAIARASKLTFLAETYQALVVTLTHSLMHAEFVEDHEELLKHNIAVHGELVHSIRTGDAPLLEKVISLHRQDLVRDGDPTWSPAV